MTSMPETVMVPCSTELLAGFSEWSGPVQIRYNEQTGAFDIRALTDQPRPDIKLPDSVIEAFDPLNGGDIDHNGIHFAHVETYENADRSSWGPINWLIYRRDSDQSLYAMAYLDSDDIGHLAAIGDACIPGHDWGPILVPVVKTGTRTVNIYQAVTR